MTIQAVIFDFGGVLYRLPDHSWIRRWQRVLNIKNDEILMLLASSPNDSQLLMDILIGKMTESEMWSHFAAHWRIHPRLLDRIRRATMSKNRLNHELANFLSGLRDRYKTAILSNAGTDARVTFSEVYGLDKVADTMIISAEEGVAKPDERIYQITMERLGIEPHEAIFLDDMEENIESARRFGLQAVRYIDNKQAISDVMELLRADGNHTKEGNGYGGE